MLIFSLCLKVLEYRVKLMELKELMPVFDRLLINSRGRQMSFGPSAHQLLLPSCRIPRDLTLIFSVFLTFLLQSLILRCHHGLMTKSRLASSALRKSFSPNYYPRGHKVILNQLDLHLTHWVFASQPCSYRWSWLGCLDHVTESRHNADFQRWNEACYSKGRVIRTCWLSLSIFSAMWHAKCRPIKCFKQSPMKPRCHICSLFLHVSELIGQIYF